MYRLIAGLYMLGWFYPSLKHIDNKGTKICKYDNNILEIWIMIFFLQGSKICLYFRDFKIHITKPHVIEMKKHYICFYCRIIHTTL